MHTVTCPTFIENSHPLQHFCKIAVTDLIRTANDGIPENVITATKPSTLSSLILESTYWATPQQENALSQSIKGRTPHFSLSRAVVSPNSSSCFEVYWFVLSWCWDFKLFPSVSLNEDCSDSKHLNYSLSQEQDHDQWRNHWITSKGSHGSGQVWQRNQLHIHCESFHWFLNCVYCNFSSQSLKDSLSEWNPLLITKFLLETSSNSTASCKLSCFFYYEKFDFSIGSDISRMEDDKDLQWAVGPELNVSFLSVTGNLNFFAQYTYVDCMIAIRFSPYSFHHFSD